LPTPSSATPSQSILKGGLISTAFYYYLAVVVMECGIDAFHLWFCRLAARHSSNELLDDLDFQERFGGRILRRGYPLFYIT
jgi:hypothetical protein